MFERHLKIIKIHFSIITLGLIFTMSAGAVFLSNIFYDDEYSLYLSKNYIEKNISYIQYKYEIERNVKKPLDAVLSFFQFKTKPDTASAKNQKLLSLPILVYHGIITKPDGSNILLQNFKEQMFALHSAGYQTVTMADAYAFLQGKKDLPTNSFLLTFDDGRKDSYYPVDPILQALGYNAVNFVISSHSLSDTQNNYYLTLGEIKQMKNSGRWEIGAHAHEGHDLEVIDEMGTLGHFFANKLWIQTEGRNETDEEFQNRIENEMKAAKNLFQSQLGITPLGFAFPFGDYGQESLNYPYSKIAVLNITQNLYPLAFYQVPSEPTNEKRNYPMQDTFLLKRIEIKPKWTQQEILQIFQMTEDKSLPFSDTFTNPRGWKNVWGGVESTADGLHLFATASTTGAMSILDGAYLWEDYIFESEVTLKHGQTYTLIGRYRDGDNSVSCKFGIDRVTLEEKINNVPHILNVWKNISLPIGDTLLLGMSVQGNQVNCILKNEVLSGNTLSKDLNRGSVGFSIWDPILGSSEMFVKNISVNKL